MSQFITRNYTNDCCSNGQIKGALFLRGLACPEFTDRSVFWTVVLEETPESPLNSKEIKPVHPEGNEPWVFTGRTDAEAEASILWPPDVKSWLTGKDPEGRRSGEQWGDKGWDSWIASSTQWTGVWVGSGRWWRTGRPGVLQSMGSQRVGHNWAAEWQGHFPTNTEK